MNHDSDWHGVLLVANQRPDIISSIYTNRGNDFDAGNWLPM